MLVRNNVYNNVFYMITRFAQEYTQRSMIIPVYGTQLLKFCILAIAAIVAIVEFIFERRRDNCGDHMKTALLKIE